VLAKGYGVASWEDLRAALDTAGFDDLACLTDREAQVMLREISQRDLSRALVGASEPVRGRMLGNMSR
jgi:flagellar motor switch protein FliG